MSSLVVHRDCGHLQDGSEEFCLGCLSSQERETFAGGLSSYESCLELSKARMTPHRCSDCATIIVGSWQCPPCYLEWSP